MTTDDQNQVKKMIQNALTTTQFAGVNKVPYHRHTGVDSPLIVTSGNNGFPTPADEGDLVYYNGTAWVALTIGTAGTVLVSNGSIPTWMTESAGSSKFGGTGADGALNITSGTTTLDLGGASIFIKNYTSINISSGATLTFSNPPNGGSYIIFRSQGNVSVLGTLSAALMGAGMNSTASDILDSESHAGGNGAGGSTPGGSQYLFPFLYHTQNYKYVFCAPGSGGGFGVNWFGGTGVPGVGGGSIYIECAGQYSATGTISTIGGNGTGTTDPNIGGGGGGGAGTFYCIYNSIGTDTATYDVSGGGGAGGGSGGSGGGGGGNSENLGSSTGSSGGGAGASGIAIREQNITWT